jgi:cysteinyl-tRNA synthetase
MSAALLGESFDIHCGGVDNIFPHHENEIAQSECAHAAPFVRYWLHSEHLLVDGEKMSKSLGNQYCLDQLFERCVSPRALRYLFLSVHYRQRLNFTFESAEQSSAALRRIDEMLARVREAATLENDAAGDSGTDLVVLAASTRMGAARALADDLNTSGALGEIFAFVREVNRRCETGITAAERAGVEALFRDLDRVFGVFDVVEWTARLPDALVTDRLCDDTIEAMLLSREESRARRDFSAADRVRDQLREAGILLEDTPRGTRWRRG